MIKDFLILIKIRITLFVIITSYLGYYLGLRYSGFIMIELDNIIIFINLVVGVFLTSSASGILNQYLEIDLDAKMSRTQSRPLPSKRINKNTALLLGLFLSIYFSQSVNFLYFILNNIFLCLYLYSIKKKI